MINIQLFKYFRVVVQLPNLKAFVGTVLYLSWHSSDFDKRRILQRLKSQNDLSYLALHCILGRELHGNVLWMKRANI